MWLLYVPILRSRRCEKLYLLGQIHFKCWHCYNLTYRTIQEHGKRQSLVKVMAESSPWSVRHWNAFWNNRWPGRTWKPRFAIYTNFEKKDVLFYLRLGSGFTMQWEIKSRSNWRSMISAMYPRTSGCSWCWSLLNDRKRRIRRRWAFKWGIPACKGILDKILNPIKNK